MSKLYIEGGKRLCGELSTHGAKNSALPLLAATLMCSGQTVLHNCPRLTDVEACIKILKYLGCEVKKEDRSISVKSENFSTCDIPDNLMREMRSSIVFLGAVIARCGQARLSFPGGCELGPRPIDLHLSSLRLLGVKIKEEHGYLDCFVDGKMKGAKIALSFPSVGATENIIISAATAEGITIITNAAREPEIIDLANYLNACGAKIRGAGEGTIQIEGVSQLIGCEHTVIPDRIAAITYLACTAITGGDILLRDVNTQHLAAVIPSFEQAGCNVSVYSDKIYLSSKDNLKAINTVRTMPYPGFPTDAQAPVMAMCTKAMGSSVFVENIFENRFRHVAELARLGADIKVEGRVALVTGVDKLLGASVEATDLRGGAALVVAALACDGVTKISNLSHLDRGYENLEENLYSLGAKISRML